MREISAKLNKVLADVFALYLKTKNFHWHISGPHFRDYHLLLDEQSEQIFAITDDIAERVRKIGGLTLRSIGQIAKLQTLEDNDEDFVPALDMLRELMSDNKALVASMRQAHEVARRARGRRDDQPSRKFHRPGRAAHLVLVRGKPRHAEVAPGRQSRPLIRSDRVRALCARQQDSAMTPSRDIGRLLDIMAALRTPQTGCPWDLAQDFSTIAPYTLEEAYEVADAIARGDLADLREELGDLLLQVVFHARMAQEQGAFDFGDVVQGITEKLIRRHPHVFGDERQHTPQAVEGLWERIKAQEKEKAARKGGSRGQKARSPACRWRSLPSPAR